LNEDGKPHRCPKRPSSSTTTTIRCKYCTQQIAFDDDRKSSRGKNIPLSPDGTDHDCPKSPFNLSKNMNNNNDSKKGEGVRVG
jgi:hypothetical protein